MKIAYAICNGIQYEQPNRSRSFDSFYIFVLNIRVIKKISLPSIENLYNSDLNSV